MKLPHWLGGPADTALEPNLQPLPLYQVSYAPVAAPIPIQPPPAADTAPSALPEKPMSWLSKYVIDPVEHAVEGSANAAPVIANAKATVASATQAVDPIFDTAEVDLIGVLDKALSAAGLEGQLATPAANLFVQMLARVAHSAIDSKLNVTSTTVTA